MKTIQVCKLNQCENKPVEEKVGKTTLKFCCHRGFQKSLSDFLKSIKQKTINTSPSSKTEGDAAGE